jgi:hypothetical protein
VQAACRSFDLQAAALEMCVNIRTHEILQAACRYIYIYIYIYMYIYIYVKLRGECASGLPLPGFESGLPLLGFDIYIHRYIYMVTRISRCRDRSAYSYIYIYICMHVYIMLYVQYTNIYIYAYIHYVICIYIYIYKCYHMGALREDLGTDFGWT